MLLSSLLSNGSLSDVIAELLLTIPVIILALSIHETAHGYVAWKCGDPTAYHMGRLTLNPIKHLDPIGFFCMMIFGYGWARPVPINTRNFTNPKRGMAFTAAAGPGANLLLGIISAVLYGLCFGGYVQMSYDILHGAEPTLFYTALRWMSTLFGLSAAYNFLFMAFNLIPIPPFDGSRIALLFLPQKVYFGLMRYEQQIMIGLLVVLALLSRIGLSPFSWIATTLTSLISSPFIDLMIKFA